MCHNTINLINMLDKAYRRGIPSTPVMETNEQTNRVSVAAKIDPAIFEAVENLAREEERTISNTIERLLKESPRVANIL